MEQEKIAMPLKILAGTWRSKVFLAGGGWPDPG
jgi:hypothetical protein